MLRIKGLILARPHPQHQLQLYGVCGVGACCAPAGHACRIRCMEYLVWVLLRPCRTCDNTCVVSADGTVLDTADEDNTTLR
jgi:hypothetical protein